MDGRLPAEPSGARATAAERASRPADAGLERRLAALEARLDDLDEAIREVLPNAFRQMVESACHQAVESEMQQVSENLRRSVSDLGRLLLKDLDRLTKLLADHRDAIVERLLEAQEEPLPALFDEPEELVEGETASGAAAGAPDGDSETAALAGEEGRWPVLPGRRREKPAGSGRRRAKRAR
jgi:restriction endonuclease Mrr